MNFDTAKVVMSAIAAALALMTEKWEYVEEVAFEVCPSTGQLAADCRRSAAAPRFLDDAYIKKLDCLSQRLANEVKKETLCRLTERIVGGIGEELFFESDIEHYLTDRGQRVASAQTILRLVISAFDHALQMRAAHIALGGSD
jgi:hypothetical protein